MAADTKANERWFAEERKQRILAILGEERRVTVVDLCERLGVSGVTVRNYLRDLAGEGLLTRTHGGALAGTKTGFESDSDRRHVQNLPAKQKIARAAAGMVEDGDTIILDTGTTTLELARCLVDRAGITVVTNDIDIARVLEAGESVQVILLGGMLRKGFYCTVGPAVREMLAGLTVDKAFMGANGFSPRKGASTPDVNQADVKKMMLAAAERVVLLCDRTKIGNVSFAQFAAIEQIDTLITDGIPAPDARYLEQHGVSVAIPE